MLKNISSSVFANSHGLCFIFSRLTPSSISRGKQLEASNVIFHCSIEMKWRKTNRETHNNIKNNCSCQKWSFRFPQTKRFPYFSPPRSTVLPISPNEKISLFFPSKEHGTCVTNSLIILEFSPFASPEAKIDLWLNRLCKRGWSKVWISQILSRALRLRKNSSRNFFYQKL